MSVLWWCAFWFYGVALGAYPVNEYGELRAWGFRRETDPLVPESLIEYKKLGDEYVAGTEDLLMSSKLTVTREQNRYTRGGTIGFSKLGSRTASNAV